MDYTDFYTYFIHDKYHINFKDYHHTNYFYNNEYDEDDCINYESSWNNFKYLDYDKPENRILDRMILSSIADETVNIRFELDADISVKIGNAINGTPVKYKFYEQKKIYIRPDIIMKDSVTNVIEFSFCFSSDDTDYVQFDPYIEYVKNFINFEHVDKLAQKIVIDASRKFKNIDIKATAKNREEKIREYYNDEIISCSKISISDITKQLESHEIPNYWAKNIAKTFTNAMISKTILSRLPSLKKTCIHIKR